MSATQQPLSPLIGQSVIVGGPIAAQVLVVGARKVFGRIDLLVRDIRGNETWVREASVEKARER